MVSEFNRENSGPKDAKRVKKPNPYREFFSSIYGKLFLIFVFVILSLVCVGSALFACLIKFLEDNGEPVSRRSPSHQVLVINEQVQPETASRWRILENIWIGRFFDSSASKTHEQAMITLDCTRDS